MPRIGKMKIPYGHKMESPKAKTPPKMAKKMGKRANSSHRTAGY